MVFFKHVCYYNVVLLIDSFMRWMALFHVSNKLRQNSNVRIEKCFFVFVSVSVYVMINIS